MNSYLVIILTLVVSALNFLYSMLNTRFLGVSDIGIYSLLIQSINTIILISDFGLSTAFLKFYTLAFKKDIKESRRVLANSIYVKSLISSGLMIVFLVIFPFIKNHFETGTKEIILTLLTLLTIGNSELIMSKYRSEQNFKKFFMYKFLFSLLRILPMIALYYLGKYNLSSAIGIFSYSSITIIFILLLSEKDSIKNVSFDKSFITELLHFSKWIFISNLALAFLTNGTFELYLLKNYADKKELGLFSSLLIFFTILSVLNTSLTTLFFPKFAGIEDKKILNIEVKKAFKMGVIISIPLIFLIPLMEIFIKISIGEGFVEAVNPARLLVLGFFIELSSQVYRLVLYINENKKIAFINLFQFIGSIVLGFILIAFFGLGIWGAVISIIVVRVIGAYFMVFYAKKSIRGN
ncbi:MAG: oligosaccharide flippase family protein [Fusobacteriaceae bacterium]|nr:oligosaccharide flippase family protein [Fusobacteriaceae bacterium]